MYMRLFLIISILLGTLFSEISLFASALPGAADAIIAPDSITVSTPVVGSIFDISRDFGLRILSAVKLVVSGFALIYIILMGVYMIVFSENEDRIKAQRRQMTYVLIAFLFINIPGTVYIIFFGDVMGTSR